MGGLEANELLGYDLILTGYTSSLDVGRETEAAVKRVLAASSQGRYTTFYTFILFCIMHITPTTHCPMTTSLPNINKHHFHLTHSLQPCMSSIQCWAMMVAFTSHKC